MKKLFFCLLLVTFSSNAQLGGLLKKNKDKVEKKTDDKVENKSETKQESKSKNKGEGKLELFEEEKLDFDGYKNNIGKICFSNEPFERTLPESKYIKSYTFGDKLSIRAFMTNSTANSMILQAAEKGISIQDLNSNKFTFENRSMLILVLYLDGKEITNTSYSQDFDDKVMMTLPTYRAELNDGTPTNFFGESLFDNLIRKQEILTPGIHKLKIELVPVKESGIGSEIKYNPIAVGEIDMIVKDEGVDPNNEKICMPKALMNDKSLEPYIIKAYKLIDAQNTPKSIKITSPKWNIVRHEYTGVILKRYISVAIGVNKSGKCSYDFYNFYQDYDGNKYQSEMYSPRASSTEVQMDCRCLK